MHVQVSVRRSLVALAAAVALVPISAGPSWACTCAQIPPKGHAKMAEVIVTGVVEVLTEGEQIDVAELAVTHVFKGPRTARLTVETSAQSSACGYDFVEGRGYTVFALLDGGSLHTNICTATTAGDIDAERFGLDSGVRVGQPAPEPTEAARTAATVAGVGLAVAALAALSVFGRRLRA